ncbi:MAG: class II aldolase/adducin family protein [Candidatus Coatesbacteria bacterium]|nr:class II aldolase/adducin family protein [Candidatus Coatesbacteria bacterium]
MQEAIESMVGEYSGKYLPESLARAAIVEVGRRTYQRGFVAANDGNISVRIAGDMVLATPTGRSKGFIREDELVKMALSGEKLEGPLRPSSEIKMHLKIYEARPDVMAVDHAHPPICTGFAVAGIPLDKCVLAEVVMTLGAVPLAEFAVPSTQELAESVTEKIRECDAVLLANHGAVTVGPDVFAAHYSMERIEHLATISLIARMLGGEKLLTRAQVEKIAEVQRASGSSLPPLTCKTCSDAVCPVDAPSAVRQQDTQRVAEKQASANTQDSERLVAQVVQALKNELAGL